MPREIAELPRNGAARRIRFIGLKGQIVHGCETCAGDARGETHPCHFVSLGYTARGHASRGQCSRSTWLTPPCCEYAYKADSGNDSVTSRLNKCDWPSHALASTRLSKRGRGKKGQRWATLCERKTAPCCFDVSLSDFREHRVTASRVSLSKIFDTVASLVLVSFSGISGGRWRRARGKWIHHWYGVARISPGILSSNILSTAGLQSLFAR